jgi:hypothetical protein
LAADGTTSTVDFTGLQHDPHDFARLGVISTDGETIKSVTVDGNFNEVKQIAFSPASGVTIPDGGETLMLLGGALCILGVARRFLPAQI